jgi:hypothetical protein
MVLRYIYNNSVKNGGWIIFIFVIGGANDTADLKNNVFII